MFFWGSASRVPSVSVHINREFSGRGILSFNKLLIQQKEKNIKMSLRCVIKDCPRPKGTSKHRFPHPEKNMEMFKLWMQYCEKEIHSLKPERIYATRRVCGSHFIDKHFGINGRLLKTAYPVLNIPVLDGSEILDNGTSNLVRVLRDETTEPRKRKKETDDFPKPFHTKLNYVPKTYGKKNASSSTVKNSESSASEISNQQSQAPTVVLDTLSSTLGSNIHFLTSKNVGTICRVCLRDKIVSKLAENIYNNEKTYAQLLELCSPIKLQEDPSLSQNICKDCVDELLLAYQFWQKCFNSEQILVNFKTEMAKEEERTRSILERKRNLTLRFHDYDRTLDEDAVRSITRTESEPPTPPKENKKRFYLVREGSGIKQGVKVREINEKKAKKLLNRKSLAVTGNNTLGNVVAGPLPPGYTLDDVMKDPVLKNTLIRNINKRKMIAYTRAIRPKIITPKSVLRMISKVPKRRSHKRSGKPQDNGPKIPGHCKICQDPFNTLDEYKEHAKASEHYSCQYCEKAFPDKQRLMAHIETNHADAHNSHTCAKCGQCFTTSNYLSIHLNKHLKGDYVCKVCKATFRTLQGIVEHKKASHKMDKKKSHCCEFCGEFFHQGTLRRHKNHVHLKIKQQFCPICDKGFQYKISLKEHMKRHADTQTNCKLCNKSFMKRDPYLRHLRTQHPGTDENTREEDEIKQMECDYCGELCQNKQVHTVHVLEDHQASICIYCDTLFESLEDLNEHMEVRHKGIPDFSCRYCGKSHPKLIALYMHLDVHRVRAHQCDLCFRRFPEAFRLKTHMLSHTRVKVYECQYCDKTFQSNASRITHERLHTGDRPYLCDICGKSYVGVDSYKKHQKTHPPAPPSVEITREIEFKEEEIAIYPPLIKTEVPEENETVTTIDQSIVHL